MFAVKTYEELLEKLRDTRDLIKELVNLNLIYLGKCPKCRRNRVLTHSTNFKDDFATRCPKCRKFSPLSINSGFFVETRLRIKSLFQILYCWAEGLTQKNCVKLTGLSTVSVNQWYRYARDVASWKPIVCEDEEKIIYGGPGTIVQIDESVVARRKYNRGKRVVLRWVLGIYDTNAKSGLVIHVKKRDAKTLIPILTHHVRKGSEIWTDQWQAYNTLSSQGYIHKTINHSKFFKDPISGVCTNQVEGFWGTMKRELRSKRVNTSHNISEHIDEDMWRKTYLKGNGNPLDNILTHISERYTG